jgi:dTMP kinase
VDIAITESVFEKPLVRAFEISIKRFKKDFWHLERMLKFANLLHKTYGGDIDVICASIFLENSRMRFAEFSDLNNGSPSIKTDTLVQVGFPTNKIDQVVELIVIRQTLNFSPNTLEAQIVHDAILLASFGVSGIVRYAMWSELSGLDISSFSNLDSITRQKISQLIFPESIRLAEKENKFLHLFSELMQQEPKLEANLPGKYIILEGNSGTGKNTQAKMLQEYLSGQGKKTVIIEEPSKIYRKYEHFWLENNDNEMIEDMPYFRLFSIIGDRLQQIYQKVYQELAAGHIVISVRSFLSMFVYQCENDLERKKINYIHQFIPRPDIMIVYDADEKICLDRVISRGSKLTHFDKLQSLEKYRPVYLHVAKSLYLDFPVEIIDVSGDLDEVAQKTIETVNKFCN